MTFKEIVEIGASVIVGLGGGGTIVLGLSSYLGKIWADRSLEKLRQEHTRLNLELTHTLDLVTEQAKHFHQMAALEHQVRFSKLHEKRAEVVAKLYALLVELQYAGQRYVSVGAYESKRDDEFSKTIAKVHEGFLFIEEHQIYLPDDPVCTLLEEFRETLIKSVAAVQAYEQYTDGSANFRQEKTQALKGAAEAFKVHIPAVRIALKDEFRKILGVENSRTPDSQT